MAIDTRKILIILGIILVIILVATGFILIAVVIAILLFAIWKWKSKKIISEVTGQEYIQIN